MALKSSRKGECYNTKENTGNWTLVFVFLSYHLNISFPSSGSHFNKLERVLETPKNGFVSTVTLYITLNKTNPGQNITNKTKFSYPKKCQNRKFQTPKNPSIIPVTWNPEYHPLGILPMNLAGNGKCAKNWNLRDRGTGAQQFRGLVMCEIHRRRPWRYKFEFSICLEWSPTIAEIWDESGK